MVKDLFMLSKRYVILNFTGAVVAREYGLPCLVGVKNATKVFKTGDIVVLSGNTGELGIA
ncbi:hypothetical protein NQ314_003147 [Rhamnusium bicolor]|uniref:PEP-utilising enzyme mobile domain-containing protein n=1 Tax=Rhamnusium bicolor TaxID=1586634 RepID=A0AAV8ZR71_9CUCU|nr:hypothetical protein NQ314_003147 [Rhamnusium bicolor]